MSNEPIRVGIVGAGGNTRGRHIPGLQAIDGVEVVSVCNRSRESSEKVAEEFNIPTVYEHWWDLVRADDTDAIVIGTWPYLHCPATLMALRSNKHVMTEARMAMNVREAQRMLRASQARPHLVTQIVPSPFTLEADRTIQRLLAEGFLGDLLAIEVRVCANSYLDPEAPRTWRMDKDLSGQNIMGLGIWYEALMRWVGEATRVMAMGRVFQRMRKDAETGLMEPVDIPEHLTVVADMACGAQAHFLLSAVTGHAGGNRFALVGTDGTLEWSGGTLRGAKKGAKEMKELKTPKKEAIGWRVEEEFVGAIRGTERIKFTTFEDGVKYMKFTEAVNRSLATGRAVANG